MSKKPYTKPTVVDLGDAVKQTKGWGGKCWESWGSAYGPPPPVFDDAEQQNNQD
jgi:hypothetical protein